MEVMSRLLRTAAAVLAGLALVAALPAPCACPPEPADAGHAGEHACCAPPFGVSAADHGCCDETLGHAQAVPSPAAADAVATSLAVQPSFAVPVPGPAVVRSAASAASPPIPLVLRI
jgi:hypothetical protein